MTTGKTSWICITILLFSDSFLWHGSLWLFLGPLHLEKLHLLQLKDVFSFNYDLALAAKLRVKFIEEFKQKHSIFELFILKDYVFESEFNFQQVFLPHFAASNFHYLMSLRIVWDLLPVIICYLMEHQPWVLEDTVLLQDRHLDTERDQGLLCYPMLLESQFDPTIILLRIKLFWF